MSGRRCAGYRVRVATKKSLFSGWVPKREERRTEGFYLDDGTGEVYVPLDEVHPVLMLATDARFTRGKNKPIRRALRDLLRVGDGAKVRFDEGAIIEGGRVAVFGTFRRRPDPRQSHTREDYREKALCFVAEAEEASALLYVSDERSFLG